MRNIFIAILILVLNIPALAQVGIVSDPMSIGMGARPLGLGRAYVAMAEDGDALFANPAGLARITNPKLTSMYSSLMSDVDYIVIGGAYPFGKKSAIGAGFINSSSGNIPLTDITGSTIGNGRWSNSVIFVSYGTYTSNFPLLSKLPRDVLLGGSLKYFSVGGDGSADIEAASGTGYSADFSAMVAPTDYLMLGANLQNAVGGKIEKESGVTDKIPVNLKMGAKLSLLGNENSSFTGHQNRKLYVNVDHNMVGSNQPNTTHAGVEFWPNSNLALRVGSDDNELTAGLGLRFSGIEFNYAYHPYNGIDDNNSHFFSFGYLGEALKRYLRVNLDEQLNKQVIHDDHVTVSGNVEVVEGDDNSSPAGKITVRVNGQEIAVNDDLTFNSDIPVEKIGKNMVRIEAQTAAGESVSQEIKLVRLVNFADIPDGYWAKNPIESIGTVGLVSGYPDGTFKPEQALTRAELATLLVKAKGIELSEGRATQVFPDVSPDFWAAKYIETAAKIGLIAGYEEDGTFRPNRKVSKAEGIAIMVRFDNLKYPEELVEKPYWDVETNFWAAKSIQAAKDAGMLKFVEDNRLDPKGVLVRAEAVDMLSQTSLAGKQIKDLFSWEKGFTPEITPERPKTRAAL
ncbi:MAG: PorV/PorQ family protein [bacterium]